MYIHPLLGVGIWRLGIGESNCHILRHREADFDFDGFENRRRDGAGGVADVLGRRLIDGAFGHALENGVAFALPLQTGQVWVHVGDLLARAMDDDLHVSLIHFRDFDDSRVPAHSGEDFDSSHVIACIVAREGISRYTATIDCLHRCARGHLALHGYD